MSARFIAFILVGYFFAGTFVSSGVVRESDLLARWSFDEGNGTIATESSGSGVDAILKDGAKWGYGDNAMSRNSLDLSLENGYALIASHPNLQSRNGFSTSVWFKSNGIATDYSQIISKDGDTYLSYFTQIEQGGLQLKTQYRFLEDILIMDQSTLIHTNGIF